MAKPTQPTEPTNRSAKRETKASHVEQSMKARNGATIAELVEVTNWLPHTTRAFLTGLRKKGIKVLKEQRKDGTTCYRLASSTATAAKSAGDEPASAPVTQLMVDA